MTGAALCVDGDARRRDGDRDVECDRRRSFADDARRDERARGVVAHVDFNRRRSEIVGDDVVLIDPAVAVATELTRRLGNDLRMDEQHIGTTRFFSTGDVLHVQQVVAHLWGGGALVEAMTQ